MRSLCCGRICVRITSSFPVGLQSSRISTTIPSILACCRARQLGPAYWKASFGTLCLVFCSLRMVGLEYRVLTDFKNSHIPEEVPMSGIGVDPVEEALDPLLDPRMLSSASSRCSSVKHAWHPGIDWSICVLHTQSEIVSPQDYEFNARQSIMKGMNINEKSLRWRRLLDRIVLDMRMGSHLVLGFDFVERLCTG